MKKIGTEKSIASYKAWSLDQLTKSQFFHEKLHSWGLLEVTENIERTKGETLDWNLNLLGISKTAWDKVIHRGIKPIIIFAHPFILKTIPRSVAYYRMLAMVSQKSMTRIGLTINRYEIGKGKPDDKIASVFATHINKIISTLIELDDTINAREFDLWRGMAAGAQAQGSWGNIKGSKFEVVISGILHRRIREKSLLLEGEPLITDEEISSKPIKLKDGRSMVFSKEPDVAIYRGSNIEVAVEIKGGIDTAAVLERAGATIKSLRRAKETNSESVTILILQEVSLTETARKDLEISRDYVNYWFTIEEIMEDENKREEVFKLLGI